MACALLACVITRESGSVSALNCHRVYTVGKGWQGPFLRGGTEHKRLFSCIIKIGTLSLSISLYCTGWTYSSGSGCAHLYAQLNLLFSSLFLIFSSDFELLISPHHRLVACGDGIVGNGGIPQLLAYFPS